MNGETNKLEEDIKNLLGETKWKETMKEIKNWMEDKKENGFSLKLGELKVEYKRDTQETVNTAIMSWHNCRHLLTFLSFFPRWLEEKAKEWICPRIPEWMTSDVLTVIGVFGALISSIGFVLGFMNRNYLLLVPAGLIINWFGDSFDGSIARYRKKTRPNYGYYIDKIVDSVVVLMFALGMGLSGFIKIENK